MPEVKYICEGTCGAVVSESEYNIDGKKVCNTDGCTHLGQPLKRKLLCPMCGKYYNEGESHACA